MMVPESCDVVVLGGGNAALSAALTARLAGRDVAIIERAPREFRGGNSRHTRNLRCRHEAPSIVLADRYSEDEFFADLMRVNSGDSDETLARIVIRNSEACTEWMGRFGVRFQSPLRGTLHLARTNAFFLGGGKAVMNSYYNAAARLGIHICYETDVTGFELAHEICQGVHVRVGERHQVVRAKAVVVATGGFESNLEWLKREWGDAADNFIVRGTPYNTGTPLKLMLEAGAQSVADARGCHAVAIDARAPRFDGGIVTRLDCIPLGIVVNTRADRFADEGEDVWPKRYASWGTLVARQPNQTAFCIVDAKSAGRFIPSVYPPIVATTIRALATKLALSPDRLDATVTAFNNAVQPGAFDLGTLDTCRTIGLTPNKSHWAQRIDTPPFWGYPLKPGITFTYLGLKVNEHGQVITQAGRPMDNVFAAGEIMAGNILRKGYIAGIGMTIGTVFGRIAGAGAADAAG
jgi:tricarballylate dehydrogenase